MTTNEGDLNDLFSPLPELKEIIDTNKKDKIKKTKEKKKGKQKEPKKRKFQPSVPICKFYQQGRCQNQDCTFLHEGPVVILKKDTEICKFHLGGLCQKGESCTFSHDFSIWPCRYYHLDGECRDKKCRFSHQPITEEKRKELMKLYKPEEKEEVLQSIENPFSKNVFNK